MTRKLVPYSPLRTYRDGDGFDFMREHIHGPLRSLYWRSGGKNELGAGPAAEITVEYLFTLPGPKRAELLRSDPVLRREYLKRINGPKKKVRHEWPQGMSKTMAGAWNS